MDPHITVVEFSNSLGSYGGRYCLDWCLFHFVCWKIILIALIKTRLAGDLWAIHGGGIYHLEKYQLAPNNMPERLHWFKWEAYFTWITGMLLLCVVYYLNAELYLMAPDSMLSASASVALGILSLFVGWFVYDALSDSALRNCPIVLALVLFTFFMTASYGMVQVFSGRGAYIHIGAMIGTIMVGNVFRVIMPAQRDLVKAIQGSAT